MAEKVGVDPGQLRRVAVASAIGTTIEWYDFFIYGTAAALVFNAQFFPRLRDWPVCSPHLRRLHVAGFYRAPARRRAVGHFGDRLGRKSMLVWSLC